MLVRRKIMFASLAGILAPLFGAWAQPGPPEGERPPERDRRPPPPRPRMPPPRHEDRPPPPDRVGWRWRPGHWVWAGDEWRWEDGRWYR